MRTLINSRLARITFPVIGATAGVQLAEYWNRVGRPDSLLRNKQRQAAVAGFIAGLMLMPRRTA